MRVDSPGGVAVEAPAVLAMFERYADYASKRVDCIVARQPRFARSFSRSIAGCVTSPLKTLTLSGAPRS